MKDTSQAMKMAENSNSLASEYARPEQVLICFPFSKNMNILSDMYIKVKMKPGAKKELIEKVSDDHYNVSVKEKAENNRANDRLLEIMRNQFTNSLIRIISGHHSPSKILSIDKK